MRLRFLKIIKLVAATLVLAVTSMSLYEAYSFSEALHAHPFLKGARFTVEAIIYQLIFALLAAASAIYLARAILKSWRSRRL